MPKLWAGTISVLFAAIFLGYQKNYKRMFAYSTMDKYDIEVDCKHGIQYEELTEERSEGRSSGYCKG